jgi:lysophospholipase L1-like esterase
VPGPTIVCPADVVTESPTGAPVVVTYSNPTTTTSSPPALVACTYPSGSTFPVGSTTDVCTVTDTIGQASCNFKVEVKVPPKALSVDRFMAFGDSVTEGYLEEPPAFTTLWKRLYMEPTLTYPFQLEDMLRRRYASEAITVINEGLGGETVLEGEERFVKTFNRHLPEAVLILHGYNEVHSIPVAEARSAIRAMARSAQVRGADVVLATLFQVSDEREDGRPGSQSAIRSLNVRIRALAQELGLGPVADLEAAFGRNSSWLGPDGLHPTPEGYKKIADTFLEAIVARFEIAPAAVPPAPTTPASLRRPSAGRQSIQRSGH